jgi:acyl-CoA thioester hydrolase
MNRIKTRIDPTWDTHTVRIHVRFNEVDSMKIVWHGHYVAYCETAREAWLAARGLSYEEIDSLGCLAPVVRMQFEFLRPIKAGQDVLVTCARIPGGEPKLEFFYEIRDEAGNLLSIAESLQVFVDRAGEVFLSAPAPVSALFANSISMQSQA